MDEFGNVRGGIRTPYVDAPLARFAGIGEGNIMCMIFGTMEKFSPAQLAAMYPTRTHYLDRVMQSLDQALEQQFLLPEDADKIWQASQKMARQIPQ